MYGRITTCLNQTPRTKGLAMDSSGTLRISIGSGLLILPSMVFCQLPDPVQLTIGNPVYTSFHCPGIPQPRMVGSSLVGKLPMTSEAPDQPIRNLAVRITTSSDFLSGTNDDVWLDIGPKAWRIADDFDKGTTKTVVIDLTTPDSNLDIPAVIPLYVRDISEVRIEKKGLCGITDAPDSIAGAMLPNVPTLAGEIEALKKQVQYAQYALDQSQSLLDIQHRLMDQSAQQVVNAEASLRTAEDELVNLPGRIADLQNQVITAKKAFEDAASQQLERSCTPLGALLTGGMSCIAKYVANPLKATLGRNADALLQAQNNLAAELQSAALRKAQSLQTLTTATAVKAAAEIEEKKDALQFDASHRALDATQFALAEAEEFSKKIPRPNVELPKPGEWKIDHVTLIVNGNDFASFDVNEVLKQGHSSWVRSVGKISAETLFANGLRVNLNKASTVSDEAAARVTTVFKISDISGWQKGPVASARAVGVLRNSPSPGDDGFVSLDLELELIEANNRAFVLDGQNDIGHKRYLRIEYKNRDSSGHLDTRYKSWPVGTRLAVEGPVLWDTDRNGFYELHPDRPNQVSILHPNESGGTSSIVLWLRRLIP
jgi:hypothetical protein